MDIAEGKELLEYEEISTNEINDLEENSNVLLNVKDLKTYFYTEEGVVKAVDGVSFKIFKDEVLGLVGETGCGKSVTALSILRLVREPGEIKSGSIKFKGQNLLELSEKEMRNFRGKEITMIFQDPLNSLNPVLTVGEQVSEVFNLHQKDKLNEELDDRLLNRKLKKEKIKELKAEIHEDKKDDESRLTDDEIEEIKEKVEKLKKETEHIPTMKNVLRDKCADIISEVGIPDARGILNRYPHELSGGMRQRVMIAMALSCKPGLLIADEPTTALDVTIQAQILDLMKKLKDEFKTSILLITHDLGIVAEMCDRIAVMYSGNIVEYATAKDLFKNPRHPYTKGLISAIPSIERRNKKLDTIRGSVPNLIYPPSGCRFHPRCDYRLEICDKVKPRFRVISDNYFIACHLYDPKYKDSPKYEWEEKELKKTKLV
ncbi:MAG: ABC transporter ATP-binding protein [Promethearchaeota archaeon]|nr:MAG: ABC transporter ATP-binding protein [Candidatus Lokiarchaeota archaeon]